ncbi:hypothetical protein JHK85_006370 [Glycine max]|nr:hypothetical protein JHK85_006370 [Glycine max]
MTLSFVDDLNYLPNRNYPIIAQILYFPLTMSIGEKSEKFLLSISLAPSVSVSTFSSIRNFEVKQMLKKISGHASSGVSNVSELLISLSSTMICRIVFRRRYDNDDEGSDANYIPFTGWIDKLKELHARLEGSFKELDNFYQEIIDEHRDQNRQHAEEKDIVDVMLQLKNESSLAFDLTFDHIKGVLMGNSRGTTTIRSTTASSSFAPLLAHEVPEYGVLLGALSLENARNAPAMFHCGDQLDPRKTPTDQVNPCNRGEPNADQVDP